MSRIVRVCLLILVLALCLALPALLLHQTKDFSSVSPASSPVLSPSPSITSLPNEAGSALPYRAVWISYLEWQHTDFSSADAFTSQISEMFDRCVDLGLNVAIVQVRPFGDALYPSEIFPFSHLCTGTQGLDPGFDPLSILVEQAHNRNLEIEAWINPYRIQSAGVPAVLADTGLAAQHSEWVKNVANGLWLAPANEEVQTCIIAGIRELCENYDIDGIHFDDYFYPTTATDFDAAEYAVYQADGGTMCQDDWRRQNVSDLVADCYSTAHSYGVRFGIAPQGNLQNNLAVQYSDVERWLREPGFVDYLMPQLYWGLSYQNDGSSLPALGNCLAQWQSLPRTDDVSLYIGLGAYRIGDGDGSDASLKEWNSGHALADQVNFLLQNGIEGIAFYRFDSLFENPAWDKLAGQEADALQKILLPFAA